MALWPLLGKAAVKAFQFAFLYVAGQLANKGGFQFSERLQFQATPKAPKPTPGAAIPVVFGTRWVKNAAVVWSGDLLIEPEEGRDKYYLGMHLAVCHSPIDELVAIKAEQITLWDEGSSDNETISIDFPGAFGGLEGEGGVVGDVDLLLGAADQPANPYLEEQLGDVPAFRGVVSVVVNQAYLTTTSSIKPWFFLVRLQDAGLSGGTAAIGQDINPVRILELALTNTAWGLGIPAAELDTTSWSAAWATLASEEFGVSLGWDTARPVGELITNILTHIMGVLYTDLATGKIVLKLIRQDYTPAELPHFDESSLVEIAEFSCPSLSELVNTVTVHYTDRDDNPQSITLHNTGLLAQMGGKVVAQDITYDSVVESELANQMAARDLYNLSTPLATLSLTGNRALLSLRLGDAFRLSWARYGLEEEIFRVTWIDYGSLTDGSITVHATEDLRGLDTPLYSVPESEWEDPIHDPSPSPDRLLYEAPYSDLLRRLEVSSMDVYPSNRGWLLVLARRPTPDAFGYGLLTSDPFHPSGYWIRGDHSFCPVGALAYDIPVEATTVTTFVRLADTRLVSTLGTYCLIEEELCEVVAFNSLLGTVTFKRGILDTVPAFHAAGARVWFAENGQWAGFERRITTWVPPRYSGATVPARCLPMTSRGTLDGDEAPEDELTFAHRFIRPYPPGRFRLNTEYWPAFITGDLAVAWAHRNRVLQSWLIEIADYVGQEVEDITPEDDTTYTLRLYDENDDLAVEATGLTGTSYDAYTVQDEIDDLGIGRPNESLRVELETVRDGYTSWQHQGHTVECRGYGMFYGAYYGE